jgi:hypothetical protein
LDVSGSIFGTGSLNISGDGNIGAFSFSGNKFAVNSQYIVIGTQTGDLSFWQGNIYLQNANTLKLGHPSLGGVEAIYYGTGYANIGGTLYTSVFPLSGSLEQRNSTNPQSYRLYNTYTSATNFERLGINWTGSVAQIYTETGSAGGSIRNLVLGTNSKTSLTIDTNNNVSSSYSLYAPSITGSLNGTASWASNAVTASFVPQSGYLYSLSTSSQAIAVANTWQELNYERSQDINSWTHATGTGRFTSSLSAYYNIRMITSLQKASGTNQSGATRMLYNGVEVTGSYSSFTFVSNNVPQEIISEATLFIESGSGIRTQVAGTSTVISVIPGVSVASPTVRPSAKIFITKV